MSEMVFQDLEYGNGKVEVIFTNGEKQVSLEFPEKDFQLLLKKLGLEESFNELTAEANRTMARYENGQQKLGEDHVCRINFKTGRDSSPD